MILTVLIGNTNTRFVWYEGRQRRRSQVVTTPALARGRLPGPGRVAGIALASVVPHLTRPLAARLTKRAGQEPFVVDKHARTCLAFKYRRKELGADRVCAAVGARLLLRDTDFIVFDFGTSATVNVVLRDGVFAGGAILPGVQMCLDGLAAGTARLPHLSPGRSASPVQRNTQAAIRAGVAALFGGGIDRIVGQVENEFGRPFVVVATGGAARVARRCTARVGSIHPYLASEGLAEVWRLNREAQKG
jgi:type III pantothenate kinase